MTGRRGRDGSRSASNSATRRLRFLRGGEGGPPSRVRRLAQRFGGLAARLVLLGGLAYGLLVGVREGYDYATTSPRFEVRALTYKPTRHVDDAHLRELLALQPGTNILSLDLDELAGRVAADPWVARASVTRVLPDALDVEVVEHEPAAVLLAGGFYLVDAEGTPFKVLEPAERGKLPVITGVSREDILSRPELVKDRVGRALEALRAYAEKRRPRLSEVHVDETAAVTLYTAELGTQLRLGREDVGRALARYDALRAALGEESDKLAVAHLDASATMHATPYAVSDDDAGSRKERVVASFFTTREAPTLVAAAHAQLMARAVAYEAEETARETSTTKREASKGNGAKRGRIPRYE